MYKDNMCVWLSIIAAVLLVIGGLNLGVAGVTKVNLLSKLPSWVSRLICVLIGCAALYNVFRRDFYLPFLGGSAFPCGPLMPKVPTKANAQVRVVVKPDSNVVYWASEEDNKIIANPWLAYGTNNNSGVARSDMKGTAVLSVRKPSSYRVPSGSVLPPHIHYRVCNKSGMLGPVKTVNL